MRNKLSVFRGFGGFGAALLAALLAVAAHPPAARAAEGADEGAAVKGGETLVEILPGDDQQKVDLTAAQKAQVEEVQRDANARLARILTEEQKKKLHEHEGLLDLNLGSILWVLAIFIVLFFILYRTAWKNVLAGLNARELRIRNDIAAAEAARVKAEETLAQYNTQVSDAENRVREMLDQARVDAERIANGMRTRAQQDAEAIREKAEQDIERAKSDALAQIYEQTATLATGVAEKILRRNLNPDDQRDLVNRSLEQLQAVRGNGNG